MLSGVMRFMLLVMFLSLSALSHGFNEMFPLHPLMLELMQHANQCEGNSSYCDRNYQSLSLLAVKVSNEHTNILLHDSFRDLLEEVIEVVGSSTILGRKLNQIMAMLHFAQGNIEQSRLIWNAENFSEMTALRSKAAHSILYGDTYQSGAEQMNQYLQNLEHRFLNVFAHSLMNNSLLMDHFNVSFGAEEGHPILPSLPPQRSSSRSDRALLELVLSEAQGGIRKQVPFSDILLLATEMPQLDASQHFQIGLGLAKLCLNDLSSHHISISSTPWDPLYHKLRASLCLPSVHLSLGNLAMAVNNFENQIEKFILSGSFRSSMLANSCESFDESSYVLAVLPLLHLMGYSSPRRINFFGQSPVALPVLLGELYRSMCPLPDTSVPLLWYGPTQKVVHHSGKGRKRKDQIQSTRKLRIGVISGSFDIQSGRIIVGLFDNSEDFANGHSNYELVALCFPTPRDRITDRARIIFHEHINLDSTNRKKTIQRVEMAQLDVIIFSDAAHDSRTFALSHYRLAPYQMMYWGWGGTLGIRTIDYYLFPEVLWSQKSCVLSNGLLSCPQEIHTEQVVLLTGLPPYARVKDKELPYSTGPDTWQKFQKYLLLPPQNRSNLYLFPGSVRHCHPEMDEAISILLNTDPLAIIIFTTPLMGRDALPPLHDSVKNDLLHPVMPIAGATQLKTRLRPLVGDSVRRLRFLPPVDDKTFFLLRSHVVAVLDPFPVGMHIPILEAMAAGVPVVSAPSLQECTNSHALSLAKAFALGVAEHEAVEFWPKSAEEYAVLLMRLAREQRLRQLYMPRNSHVGDHASQVLSFCSTLLGM